MFLGLWGGQRGKRVLLQLNVMLGRSTFSTARQKTICVTSTCIYSGPYSMEGKRNHEAGLFHFAGIWYVSRMHIKPHVEAGVASTVYFLSLTTFSLAVMEKSDGRQSF